MRALLDAQERAFQDEVREFLEDWRDLDAYLCHGPVWPRVAEFFEAVGAKGWLSLGWPTEFGGEGRPPSYEYLLWDEVAFARAARNPIATIVARSLIRAGDSRQRAQWLPAIRSGTATFALAYSEPEAGSDLASLRTRAQGHGDRYVIRGEKCWQSYAGHVDHLWCLARTGSSESRGGGLSLFIVDTDSPGLEISPLPTLEGDALFECHFDDVEVDASRRVGPEDGAWSLMSEALADERHIQFPAGRLRRDLVEVEAWLVEVGRVADPVVQHALAELRLGVAEAEVLALEVVELAAQGRDTVVAAAANKVFHTERCQDIARAAFEWGGPDSLVHGARVQLLWLQSMWETIGGGTSEVMRGVVARQGLGLSGRR